MRRPMRPGLGWALLVTLLATVASLLWKKSPVIEANVTSVDRDHRARAVATPSSDAVSSVSGLPLTRITTAAPAPAASAVLSEPGFDPFVGVVPPAPPPVPIAQTAPPAAPPPPPPPPQDYRFLGRVTGPDGVRQILLTRGDTTVSIEVGMALDNGYVVESISAQTVVLRFGNSDTKSALAIPSGDEAR